jgi:hypothetical protein
VQLEGLAQLKNSMTSSEIESIQPQLTKVESAVKFIKLLLLLYLVTYLSCLKLRYNGVSGWLELSTAFNEEDFE